MVSSHQSISYELNSSHFLQEEEEEKGRNVSARQTVDASPPHLMSPSQTLDTAMTQVILYSFWSQFWAEPSYANNRIY